MRDSSWLEIELLSFHGNHGIGSRNMAGETKEFTYTPKAILLTGGCGFIGSHVVIRLVQNYPETEVVVLDKLDYCGSLKNLEEVSRLKNFTFVKGDILSADLVRTPLSHAHTMPLPPTASVLAVQET